MTTKPLPSSVPVLRRVLLWGLVATVALAVVSALIAGLVLGPIGAWSAAIGAGLGFIFLGITALSILIAVRYSVVAFFGIVMGAWILKFVLFLVAAFTLKAQPWIATLPLFLTLIVSVVLSLALDVIVVARSRMPYVSDIALPGEDSASR